MTVFSFVVRCPFCDSRNIVCSAEVIVVLSEWPGDENYTRAVPYDEDVEALVGNKRCGCRDCGEEGILREWVK